MDGRQPFLLFDGTRAAVSSSRTPTPSIVVVSVGGSGVVRRRRFLWPMRRPLGA
jgi:hypothetical protein